MHPRLSNDLSIVQHNSHCQYRTWKSVCHWVATTIYHCWTCKLVSKLPHQRSQVVLHRYTCPRVECVCHLLPTLVDHQKEYTSNFSASHHGISEGWRCRPSWSSKGYRFQTAARFCLCGYPTGIHFPHRLQKPVDTHMWGSMQVKSMPLDGHLGEFVLNL